MPPPDEVHATMVELFNTMNQDKANEVVLEIIQRSSWVQLALNNFGRLQNQSMLQEIVGDTSLLLGAPPRANDGAPPLAGFLGLPPPPGNGGNNGGGGTSPSGGGGGTPPSGGGGGTPPSGSYTLFTPGNPANRANRATRATRTNHGNNSHRGGTPPSGGGGGTPPLGNPANCATRGNNRHQGIASTSGAVPSAPAATDSSNKRNRTG